MTVSFVRASLRLHQNSGAPIIDARFRAEQAQPLLLCAGLQSSGSTLVSWCFLQRHDVNGILDSRGDLLTPIPRDLETPYAWCKSTISGFRLRDMARCYEDEGWQVRPLLVVRDVRAVLNSLLSKSYGRNGTTAEQPPLRLRLARFKEDWEYFRERSLPILRYESLVQQPEQTLRQVCRQMGLAWDRGMLTWPKPVAQIVAPVHGNRTFLQTRRANVFESVRPELAQVSVGNIPRDDVAWIEREFAEYHEALDYPRLADVADAVPADRDRAVPCYENTRRYRKRHKTLTTRLAQWVRRLGRR